MTRAWIISFCLLLPLLNTAALAAEKAAYDSNGRIIGLLSSAEDFPVASSVVAVLPSGRRIPLQVRGASGGAIRQDDGLAWSVPFALPDGSRGRLELQSQESASTVRYSATVTAETNLDVDAIEFVIDIPRPAFLGGQLTVDGARPVVLGPVKPRDGVFFRGQATALDFEDRAGVRTLDISFNHPQFDEPREFALLDRWDTAGRSYQLRVPFQHGPWTAGASVLLTATLRLTDKPTTTPVAHLTVDTASPRYTFQGFGGNYCWDNRSPIAAYTLDHLKIAWARTAMKLVDWDKQRDKRPENLGAELRADFAVMQRLRKMRVPFVMSIWSLPERFYTDAYEKAASATARAIDPEKWDELLALIGDYLLYAKREYSVEPDLFSFNEANIGINIGQTPEAHARAIQRVGAYFQKIGLKTKMLLGDAAGPRDTHNFALAAASDPGAPSFIGAVAFHSWGGGSSEQYAAWGDLAQWLNLPLLVTEVGVDASAYHTRAWDSYDYGLREARMIQELLTSARPQAMLFWQYTNDYALARVRPDGIVEPTARFWIMKQFADLTPPASDALTAASDRPGVLFTAFRAGNDYALHILNLGAARSIEIAGVPDAEWRVIETTEDAQYVQMPAVRSSAHGVTLDLPSRSLVTLAGKSSIAP
jgi:hypothetical protein